MLRAADGRPKLTDFGLAKWADRAANLTQSGVAAGTPTVGLFGRALPERFFPYPAGLGHRAVYNGVWCSPCPLDVCSHTSCMRSISVDRVWHALSEILTRSAPWPAAAPALVTA